MNPLYNHKNELDAQEFIQRSLTHPIPGVSSMKEYAEVYILDHPEQFHNIPSNLIYQINKRLEARAQQQLQQHNTAVGSTKSVQSQQSNMNTTQAKQVDTTSRNVGFYDPVTRLWIDIPINSQQISSNPFAVLIEKFGAITLIIGGLYLLSN